MTDPRTDIHQLRAVLLAAAERFRDRFEDSSLEAPPRRQLAVLTCMDARVRPLALLGLKPGDAHVIRNAGAHATDDVLRSLALSHHLMGVDKAVVIGHTECGLLGAENDRLHDHVRARGADPADTDFLPFIDLDASVQESVQRIRTSPLLAESYDALGFVFDVRSGTLRSATD